MTGQSAPQTHRKWIFILLFLGWAFSTVALFYLVQKPLSIDALQNLSQTNQASFSFSFTALGRTLLDLLAGVWLWLLNVGIGLRLYYWLGLQKGMGDELATLESVIIGSGLGFGALGLAVLFLGLAGFITPVVLYTTAIILTAIVAPQTLKTLRRIRIPPPPRLLQLYFLLSIGLALSIALLPPTDWDGLFYHLTGPKLYLAAGRIIPGIDIPHLNFPSLFEMHFLLALALRGPVTAKLLHFVFSFLLAGLVYLIARRHLALRNGWLAVIFLFSMPMVLTLAGWAYNDLALTFYQIAALYALLQWQMPTPEQTSEVVRPWPAEASAAWVAAKDGGRLAREKWLVLSGLCCGLAMSLKYTSFIAPVTLVALLLWWQGREKAPIGQLLKSVLVFTLAAALVALPWYLKNRLFTGNPVYPFVFDGLFWDDFRAAAYSGAGSGVGFAPLTLITLPYQLTLGIKDANYIDGRTGPLFLIFLPLLLLYGLFRYRPPLPTALNGLLIFALAQYSFWMLGVIWSQGLWQSRLLLPAFVALCPVLAWILNDLRHLNQPQFSLQRFLNLLIGLVLLVGVVDQVFSSQSHSGWLFYKPLAYIAGSESQAGYLTRRIGLHYKAMAEMNTQFPANAVVTLLWEPRSYYCQVDCRPDSILDEYDHLQYLYGQDAAAIAAAWREKGITHVLVHRRGLNFLLAEENVTAERRPNPKVLNDLERDHLDLIFDIAGAYQGYRLN